MTQFYDALKALASHELISEEAIFLDEKESGISKAVSSIIPSFLGTILKKGNSPKIREIFEEAGNLNILAELKSLWQNQPTHDQQKIGDNFLQELLGDRAADFTALISSHSGISKIATNKLVSMIAPIVAGFLGNKMVKENYSLHSLLNEIDKEKIHFKNFIPAGLIDSFGLSSVFDIRPENKNEEKVEKKTGNKWLKWLAALLVLLLLIFWWRACQNKTTDEKIASENVIVTDTFPKSKQESISPSVNRETTELGLPNGVKLNAYKDGIEDQIVKFLESDSYKQATDKDLKDKWFKFDNIDFEFGSSTELKPESKIQMDNLVQILKYYKNSKIEIGAFADKVGNKATNLEISQKRAETIKSILTDKGVGAQVIKAQGYGDEYAKHKATESDAQRAEDRNMALRFVK